MLNIIDGYETLNRNIRHWIQIENTTNGLLEDVNTIKEAYANNEPIDTPCVWIVQQPSKLDKEKKQTIVPTTIPLITTVEFVCVDMDIESITNSERLSEHLASRVVGSILRNFSHIREDPINDPKKIVTDIEFNAFLPNGSVKIAGKSDSVPAVSAVLDFKHRLNWLNCKKKKIKD